MSPYFSIILPIYNVAPYLRRCVQSVLEQKFRNFELILVDDGSTDASPEICDELGAQHECIRVIHKANGGLSSARNAGMEIACGEYIWWVDSDDWVAPDALELLHQASCEKRPDMVKFNYVRVEGDERPFTSNVRPGVYEQENANSLLDAALFTPMEFCLSVCLHIYSRTFLEKQQLTFVSERIVGSEDYLFNLQAFAVAQSVQMIPQRLYYYEKRDGSLSQRYKKDLPGRYTQLYSQLKQFYSKIGLLDRYERKICRFYVWHLIHGTCISNEYRVCPSHSMEEGRNHIQRFLNSSEIRYAVKHCDCTGLSWKQRLQLLAMLWRLEGLFYRLYVKK